MGRGGAGGSGMTTDLGIRRICLPIPVWSSAIYAPSTQDERVHWAKKCTPKFMSFPEPQNVDLLRNQVIAEVGS